MVEIIAKGGPIIWLILGVSVMGAMIFAERLFYYRRITIRVGEFLQGLANLVRRKNYAEALHECLATPGPVARVIHAALIHRDRPRTDLREIIEESGQLEVPRLERNLGMMMTLAHLAPLLGVLGTVLGLLETFSVISEAPGVVTAQALSGGVYTALLTSAFGLAAAIPAFTGANFLNARVRRIMHDIERGGIEILNLLTEPEYEADIIEFRHRGDDRLPEFQKSRS